VTASHDGYLRLQGRVTHKRSVKLSPTSLEVSDELSGRYENAVSHLLLHPDVTIHQLSERKIELRRSLHIATLDTDGIPAQIEPAMWHPEFGSACKTHRISLTLKSPRLTTKLSWTAE
jgi:uncharacterized heparinase superfamily protein